MKKLVDTLILEGFSNNEIENILINLNDVDIMILEASGLTNKCKSFITQIISILNLVNDNVNELSSTQRERLKSLLMKVNSKCKKEIKIPYKRRIDNALQQIKQLGARSI